MGAIGLYIAVTKTKYYCCAAKPRNNNIGF
jgi:methylphosphotriester-DNA--protein-cysteine methyltransferase